MKIYFCTLGKHHWKYDTLQDMNVEIVNLSTNDEEKNRDCKDCKKLSNKHKTDLQKLEDRVLVLETNQNEIITQLEYYKEILGLK